MLFDMRFREGIRSGEVTVTFRAWKRRMARPGATHRLFGDTLICVTAVDLVSLADVDDGDATRAGFTDRDALLAYLRTGPGGDLHDSAEVYRVAFTFAGDIEDAPAVVTEGDVERALAKLAEMDRRSNHGPWTREALELVATMPATLAARLAAKAGCAVPKFKADVRRLKYMGLTRSLAVGYELTELGGRVRERLS